MKYCDNCGNELKKNYKYCNNCGKKIDNQILNNQTKKVKIYPIILLVIGIGTILYIIFFYNKNSKIEKEIEEKLYGIDYQKIEITSTSKCRGNCTSSCDGSCFYYEKIDDCKKYNVRIYMDKTKTVDASLEKFDDGLIRKDTINTNINKYLELKSFIDTNFDYEYKELKYSYGEFKAYLKDNLSDVLNEEFLKDSATMCTKLKKDDRQNVMYIFNDKYKYYDSYNEDNYKMYCSTSYNNITNLNFYIDDSSQYYISIQKETNYEEELEKMKLKMKEQKDKQNDN